MFCSIIKSGSKAQDFIKKENLVVECLILAISTQSLLLGKTDAQKTEENSTCFLTLVYVCSLDKNARQHMQKLCKRTIHMEIPLYLNNFFSGA